MKTTERDLDWLLQNLIERTPETRHALVLSKDGLKLCHTHGHNMHELVEQLGEYLIAQPRQAEQDAGAR
jgi:predicted regulator of Ras-like GTPase activity (Roadblock/LC7/MglB family)